MANDEDDDSQVMGNVTLPYNTVERMKKGKREAERQCAALKARIAELELGGAPGTPADGVEPIGVVLARGIRHALAIVQWAQGNYDPETVRGWPHEDLAALALTMKRLPGVTQNELEWATDAIHYAGTARAIERARQLNRQHEIKNIPRSSMADGSYKLAVENMLTQPPAVSMPLPGLPSAEPTAGPGAASLVGQVAEQAQQQQSSANGEAEAEPAADAPPAEPKPGN